VISDNAIVSQLAPSLAWFALFLAASATGAVVVERALHGLSQVRQRRFEQRYTPIVRRALVGDAAAEQVLVECPRRDRINVAVMLITPLIEDRDAWRIARTREIFTAMSLVADANRFLESRLWWRRAIALRGLGLLQSRDHTGRVVAALDDANADVRAAALDALADLHDPASLPALVVRLLDTTLHYGRRVEALSAFGPQAEPMVLELSTLDAAHRVAYARALGLCGTAASRELLCEWTTDGRPEVRAAAFDALARIGLDDRCVELVIRALDVDAPIVRAAAAHALHGWTGAADVASHLARHLDDTWAVAVPAARTLQSMVPAGLGALRACAPRTDLAGLLARQMLWEAHAAC
jgi:hypothetical protein